jgi:hypothetical protein
MKRMGATLVLLLVGPGAVAEDRTRAGDRNARETVEGWVAAALAGEVDKATPLAVPDTSPATEKGVRKFKRLVSGAAVKIATVYVSEKRGQAAALSEPVTLAKANPDGRDTGVLSFRLVRVGGKWLLKDLDFDTTEKGKERLQDFRKKYSDANGLPAKPKG